MKKLYLPFVLLMVLSLVLSACAPATPVPTEEPAPVVTEEPVVDEGPDLDTVFSAMLSTMTAYNTIKADALLVELATDKPPFLLDVRTVEEVTADGHIEGAAHIPLDVLAQNLNQLPAFDTPIVTYCKSGWRCTIAMTALHGMGWTNVRALKEKFADLSAAGFPIVAGLPEAMVLDAAQPAEALVAAADAYLVGIKDHGEKYGIMSPEGLNTALIEKPELILVDVRTQAEIDKNGAIDAPNTVTIPLEEFITRQAEWPAADNSIAIYCGSGHRSTMAMTMLFAYGYNDVVSLQGGFNAWKAAGYATIGGEPTLVDTFSVMLANMTAYNTLKANALIIELAEDKPPFLLDVRSVEEVTELGHIEGATHIPLPELAQNLHLLPAFDTPIVTYCKSGWRCTIAMTSLHGMGWTNVRALKEKFADLSAAGLTIVPGLPEPMALNAATPAAGLVTAFDPALKLVKELGWGIISPADFNTALVEKPELIVIDVRTVDEMKEKGVIATEQKTVVMPLETFIAERANWPADKNAEVVIYCGSGHRSTMAMTILLSHGYTNVKSLQGGFNAWVAAELPVAEYAAP